MPIPCKLRRAWLILASDWAWDMGWPRRPPPPRALGPHSSTHPHPPAVFHPGGSPAVVRHRPVRELSDRHRDRVHRADAMALVIVIDPSEARLHGPQPPDDRPIVALRPPVTIPTAVVAVPISRPVSISPVVAGPVPGAIRIRGRCGIPGQAAVGVDRRRRDRNAGPPCRRRSSIRADMIRRRGHPQLSLAGPRLWIVDSRLGIVHRCLSVIGPPLRVIGPRLCRVRVGVPGIIGPRLSPGDIPARMPTHAASVARCSPDGVRIRAAPVLHLRARRHGRHHGRHLPQWRSSRNRSAGPPA